MGSDSDFSVFVRREPSGGVSLTVRFEARKGLGLLHLRRGRSHAPPRMASVQEESDVSGEELRAGRFVYQPSRDKPRQSYSLARLAIRDLGALPAGEWVTLTPSTEQGFRYLLLAEVPVPEESVSVSVTLSGTTDPPSIPPPPQVARTVSPSAAARIGVPRPKPVAKVNAEPSHTLPPGSMPASLRNPPPAPSPGTLGEDPTLLKREVERLHLQVAQLQRQLERSHSRERDLIDIIAKWEDREEV